MSEYGPTEILRRTDGSIDIDVYAARAHLARCDARNKGLRTGTRILMTNVRTVALRLTRLVRPKVTFE